MQDGLVSRLNRPGGNVTGISRLSVALEPKRLELLHEVAPKASVIGFLINPLNPRTQLLIQRMQEPVHSLGLSLNVLEASTEGELATAFASAVQQGVGGQYRHGDRTKAAIAEQRKFGALLKMLRAGLT